MTLGEKIKQLRVARGWSQYELAKLAGIPRGSLASAEINRSIPKTDMLLKLAYALNIPVEELYEVAGYEVGEKVGRREETPEELAEKLIVTLPASIPVYKDFQLLPSGIREEPIRYIFRRRELAVGRNLEAYVIKGQYMRMEISDGDIALVDRDLPGEAGDMVLCLFKGETIIGKLELREDELWLISDGQSIRFSDCEASAKVVEIRKKLE